MSIATDVEMYTGSADTTLVTNFTRYHVKQISMLAANVAMWRDKMITSETNVDFSAAAYDVENKVIISVFQENDDFSDEVGECRRLSIADATRVNRNTNSIYAPSKYDPIYYITNAGLIVSPNITGASKSLVYIPFDTGILFSEEVTDITNFPSELDSLLIVSVAISILQERTNEYLFEQEDAELVQLNDLHIKELLLEQQKLMTIAGFAKGEQNAT